MYGNLNPRRQIVCPKTIQNVQHMTNGRPCGMTRTMFTEHMFFYSREKCVHFSVAHEFLLFSYGQSLNDGKPAINFWIT